MLKLTRPIVFFDLETTGVDRENDRIIQIAMQKIMPDRSPKITISIMLNPGIPIPAASTAIHGIRDEDVKDCKRFEEVAGELFEFFVGCDVGGFGSNWFDVPLLFKEFQRVGIFWNYMAFHMIDVGNLFKIQEPRNLANAVQFYCGRKMENAHNAAADINETVNVFEAQLAKYTDLPETVEAMALFTNYNQKVADLSGKFVYNTQGVLLLNFGKYKGMPASECIDFVHWMYYKADFPSDTNIICEQVLGIVDGYDPGYPW